MKALTKAEEQVMQALWKIGQGFIRDILEALPVPKPHQNTVATLLKILVEKGFAAIRVIGRQHLYYPLVSKDAYSKSSLKNMVRNYFSGSYSDAVSFMIKENNLSLDDLEALVKQMKKAKK